MKVKNKDEVVVSLKNVDKSFGDKKVLDDVSFDVYSGEILGLLGPNGAGKTTIVRILSTLLKGDGGQTTVDGIDVDISPAKVREQIGFAGQFAAVDDILTGRQNLDMIGRLYHMPKELRLKRVNEVLKLISLEKDADRSVRTYSGGMRRRLDLGASLIYTPKILFLDEPTTGLDPKTRRDLWKTIRDMVAGGVTLLLTTQYLEEADELADRIVVIDKGKLIANGTPSELKKKIRGDILEVEIKDVKQLKKAQDVLKKQFGNKVDTDNELRKVRFSTSNGIADLEKTLELLKKNGVRIEHINLSQPTLDDVFLELTGGGK